nr:unnamed protein product [Callosobruchus chinensis]
MIREHLVKTS